MNRRVFVAALMGGAFGAGGAFARDRTDDIIRDLEKGGYRIVEVGRTLLGRVRIIATRAGGQREIILNPNTGEILRDLWTAGAGGGAAGGGAGGAGDDDSSDSGGEDDGSDSGSDEDSDGDSDGDSGGDSGGDSDGGDNSDSGGGDHD